MNYAPMNVTGQRTASNPVLPGSSPGGGTEDYLSDPLWVRISLKILFVIWLTAGIIWLSVVMFFIAAYWVLFYIRAGFTQPESIRLR